MSIWPFGHLTPWRHSWGPGGSFCGVSDQFRGGEGPGDGDFGGFEGDFGFIIVLDLKF